MHDVARATDDDEELGDKARCAGTGCPDRLWTDVHLFRGRSRAIARAALGQVYHSSVSRIWKRGRVEHFRCLIKCFGLANSNAAGPGVVIVASAEIGRAHVELQSLMRISYAVFCLQKKK